MHEEQILGPPAPALLRVPHETAGTPRGVIRSQAMQAGVFEKIGEPKILPLHGFLAPPGNDAGREVHDESMRFIRFMAHRSFPLRLSSNGGQRSAIRPTKNSERASP
jgi:hypothetical protein